jgi:hypothetical protein
VRQACRPAGLPACAGTGTILRTPRQGRTARRRPGQPRPAGLSNTRRAASPLRGLVGGEPPPAGTASPTPYLQPRPPRIGIAPQSNPRLSSRRVSGTYCSHSRYTPNDKVQQRGRDGETLTLGKAPCRLRLLQRLVRRWESPPRFEGAATAAGRFAQAVGTHRVPKARSRLKAALMRAR